jgi:hypothetical protein
LVAVLDLEDPDLGGAGGGERFLDHVAAGGGEAELLFRLAGAGDPDGVALELALGAGQLGMAAGVKVAGDYGVVVIGSGAGISAPSMPRSFPSLSS